MSIKKQYIFRINLIITWSDSNAFGLKSEMFCYSRYNVEKKRSVF